MRRAVTPAIPPSMYRHFAIVTILLTLGLAMFADGENREAQAAQVARPMPAPVATPAAFAEPSTTAGPLRTPPGWNDDASFDSGFGGPTQRPFSGGGALPGADAADPSELASDSAASLSRAERERLLQEMRRSIVPPPAQD